jgi:hypothetical protein
MKTKTVSHDGLDYIVAAFDLPDGKKGCVVQGSDHKSLVIANGRAAETLLAIKAFDTDDEALQQGEQQIARLSKSSKIRTALRVAASAARAGAVWSFAHITTLWNWLRQDDRYMPVSILLAAILVYGVGRSYGLDLRGYIFFAMVIPVPLTLLFIYYRLFKRGALGGSVKSSWYVHVLLLICLTLLALFGSNVVVGKPNDWTAWLRPKADVPHTPLPEELSYVTYNGWSSSGLPESKLGKADDDKLYPRKWMVEKENAARGNSPLNTFVPAWVLAKEFQDDYPDLNAVYFNAGTATPITDDAYILAAGKPYQPLDRLKHDEGSPVYSYKINGVSKGEQVLIFVGISTSEYQKIQSDPKFKVRTRQ